MDRHALIALVQGADGYTRVQKNVPCLSPQFVQGKGNTLDTADGDRFSLHRRLNRCQPLFGHRRSPFFYYASRMVFKALGVICV